MNAENVRYYKHTVGDGLHYVNDDFFVYDDGSYHLGESSDICILLNTQILCSSLGLQPIHSIWTSLYPDDPMTEDDAAFIISSAIPYTEPYDPTMIDNWYDVVKDLYSIGRDKLADYFKSTLRV